jgi:hypothetical protein
MCRLKCKVLAEQVQGIINKTAAPVASTQKQGVPLRAKLPERSPWQDAQFSSKASIVYCDVHIITYFASVVNMNFHIAAILILAV